ncbi:MAG: HD domain-containing protein [Actinomycetota bacterium]
MTVTVDELLDLYRSESAQTRYDESVTELEHALQAAALADGEGAGDELVVAALLHDVGHLLVRDHRRIDEDLDVDHRHEQAGADALAALFGPDVAEPVRHHVAAKRYLCATEPDYRGRLSPASIRSLAVQGGVMSPDEVADFEAGGHAEAAVRLRRWDEEAKIAGLDVPPFDHWLPLLRRLAR